MQNMSLRQIAAACKGTFVGDAALLDREVSCVVIDSRKIEEDGLFVAMRGENTDGHRFIAQVFENGGLCAVGEDEAAVPAGHAYIRVESSAKALQDIAAWYRSTLDIKVVGITGSVGKTSTKETIAAVLSQKYNVLKTEANFNNEIGLPLTVFCIKPEHEVAVLEMGINHFGEMSRLAAIARPDICVITNIGNCHLEFLGDRPGVMKAKTEMFDYLSSDGSVVLNGDDDLLRTIRSVHGKKPVFFGFGENNDCRAVNLDSQGLLGTACRIELGDRAFDVSIPIPGEHAVCNTLAACAVASILGVPDEQIISAVYSLRPLKGRGQVEKTAHYTLVNDCYNANPASMRAALGVLGYAKGRKVAVTGDMLELGDEKEKLHYDCGTFAAEKGIDLLLTVGPLGAAMAQGARDAVKNCDEAHTRDMEIHDFPTLGDLLAHIRDYLKDGDTILVKASHAMQFDLVLEALRDR